MSDFKKTENQFRETLQSILNDPFYSEAITFEIRKELDSYLADKFAYFSNNKYHNEEIAIKNTAVNIYLHIIGRIYFFKKKQLLDFQASLISQ